MCNRCRRICSFMVSEATPLKRIHGPRYSQRSRYPFHSLFSHHHLVLWLSAIQSYVIEVKANEMNGLNMINKIYLSSHQITTVLFDSFISMKMSCRWWKEQPFKKVGEGPREVAALQGKLAGLQLSLCRHCRMQWGLPRRMSGSTRPSRQSRGNIFIQYSLILLPNHDWDFILTFVLTIYFTCDQFYNGLNFNLV